MLYDFLNEANLAFMVSVHVFGALPYPSNRDLTSGLLLGEHTTFMGSIENFVNNILCFGTKDLSNNTVACNFTLLCDLKHAR